MKNFNLLTTVVLFGMATASCNAQDQGGGGGELDLVEIATGFSSPTVITNAGDERMFVVRQPGTVDILYRNGTTEDVPFIDLTDRVHDQGNEQGLLGLAFPPDYCETGYFYVNYTYREAGQNYTRVSRLSTEADNANLGDPNSEEVLMQFEQPYTNHNGGHLEFGPDSMLYIATGDGGLGGDPQNNGQDIMSHLGKLLRIDVSEAPEYTIPEDNPYAFDDFGLDELWDFGLRNPWKFAFDSETGDLFIADVGQNAWEEINFEPAGSTGEVNYGWRCYEGTHEYDLSQCEDPIVQYPVYEYSHSGGGGRCSVTGGRVYRGPSYDQMVGKYFFTDLCSGEYWSMESIGGEWTTVNYGAIGASSVTTFGSDVWGEMYLATSAGTIYRLVDPNDSLVDPIVFEGGNQLSSTLEGTEYQWVLDDQPLDENSQTIDIDANGLYGLTVITEGGCEVDAGQIEITSVGTTDLYGQMDLSVFPNPGKDGFSLRLEDHDTYSDKTYLELRTPEGKLVQTQRVRSGVTVVSTMGLSVGLYIVKVVSDGRIVGVSQWVKD